MGEILTRLTLTLQPFSLLRHRKRLKGKLPSDYLVAGSARLDVILLNGNTPYPFGESIVANRYLVASKLQTRSYPRF